MKIFFGSLLFLMAFISYSKVKVEFPKQNSIIWNDSFKVRLKFKKKSCYSSKTSFIHNNEVLKSVKLSKSTFKVDADQERSFLKIKIINERCGSTSLKIHILSEDVFFLGDRLANTFIQDNPSRKLKYNWTEAILFYGVVQYLKGNNKNIRLKKYVEDYYQYQLYAGLPRVTSPDLAASSLGALDYKVLINSSFHNEDFIESSYEYLKTEKRNSLGALNHVGENHRFHWLLPKTKRFVKSSIWTDSLIMYALNALKIAKLKNDTELLTFSLKQPQIFIKHLREANGLFKHAYYLKSKKVHPKSDFWARGNAWVALCFIEYFDHMNQESNLYVEYKKTYIDLIDSLIKTLGTIKVFTTLLEDRSSYFETSSTAMIAYSIFKGVRKGVLPQGYLKVALSIYNDLLGLTTYENGEVYLNNVSGPTNSFPFKFYYKHLVPLKKNLTYGVGPMLMLISEVALLKR